MKCEQCGGEIGATERSFSDGVITRRFCSLECVRLFIERLMAALRK